MVMLSLAKQLGILAVKTFANTLANGLKKEASYPPKLRQLVINLGQTNHRLMTRMERHLHGLARHVPIHPLDEEKAIQAGTLFLAELSMYMELATVISGVKSYISAISTQRKEILKQELQAIKTELYTRKQIELLAGKQVELPSSKKDERLQQSK